MKKHNFSEKKLTKIKALLASAIILAVVIVLSVALLILKKWESNQQSGGVTPSPQLTVQTKNYKGQDYKIKRNVDTILVMGLDENSFDIVYDKNAINNNQEADFLILFVFDNSNHTYSALHINRDTMAEMDIFGTNGEVISSEVQQIALAHTYGDGKKASCKNTVKAVEDLLNNEVDIDSYVAVAMDSVAEVNDILGGIEVTVLQDLTYADPELSEGTTLTLKGSQALTYVRTRYGLDDSSNKARMERQKQYLENLFNKMNKSIDADNSILEELSKSNTFKTIEANNVNIIESILKELPQYEFEGIYSLEGEYITAENDKGSTNMQFYPFDDSIEESVINIMYNPVTD